MHMCVQGPFAKTKVCQPCQKKLLSLCFSSIACLAALQRHGECLALVNKRLEAEHDNPDLYVMRARLHQLFRNVSLYIL